jgi:hypothetical protein
MPLVGFELMMPVFERAKTVHALDRAATVYVGGLKMSHLFTGLFAVRFSLV